MKNQKMINEIKSKYILKYILNYVNNKNFQLKLFIHSKYFQNKLEINLLYCYKKYLDELGFDFKRYLYKEEDEYEKDILTKEYNNLILKKYWQRKIRKNSIWSIKW